MAAKQQLVTEIIVKDQNSAQVLGKSEAAIIDFAKAAEAAGRKVEKAFAQKNEAIKKTQVQATNLQKSFSSMRVAVLGAAAAVTVGIATFIKITKEAAEAERSINKLRINLELVGVKSAIVAKTLIAQAEALQKTTRFSDDAIISTQSLLVSLGVAPSKLAKATKAVVDTAAATGRGLEDVAAALGKSFAGSARELRVLVPEIGNLTEAQLKAGAAVDFLAGRFEGAAAKEVKSFSGALEQAKNALSDVFEELGGILTSSPAVIGVINQMSDAFSTLAENIKASRATGQTKELNALNAQRDLILGKEDTTRTQLNIARSGAMTGERKSYIAALERDIVKLQQEGRKVAEEIWRIEGNITKEKVKQTTAADKEFAAADKKRKAIIDQEKSMERAKELRPKIEDIEKDLDKELDAKADAITREFLMRKQMVDEARKVEAISAVKHETLIEKLLADRQKKLSDLNTKNADDAAKKAKEAYDKEIEAAQESASLLSAGSTANVGGALSAAGPQGIIAAGIMELVVNSGELPDKIKDTMSGIEKGVTEGIPKLIDYLSSDFIADLAGMIGNISKSLFQNAGSILKGGIEMGLNTVSGGLYGGIKKLLGFGGPDRFSTIGGAAKDKKIFEDFTKSVNKLADSISSAADSLREPGSALGRAKKARGRAGRESGAAFEALVGTLDIKDGNAAIKDAEKFTAAVEAYGTALQEEADAIVEIANLRIAKIEEEKTVVDQLISKLTGLRTSVVDTFRSAINAVRAGLESPAQTVERLRSNLSAARTPEAKATAANALAGGLQSKFESLQGLAAMGAITGEELAREQQAILSELKTTRDKTVSDFDRLIEKNKEASDAMGNKIDDLKEQAIKQVDRLEAILLQLKRGDVNTIVSGRRFAHGTEYVGKTGMALVHQGERIVSPENRTQGPAGGIVININGVPASGSMRQEIVKVVQDALKGNLGNLRGQIQTGGR